ncbi:MAG: sigma-70 region 4 domain-containing protein [Chlorobium sp.]|uniref:RNA polymerase subunit sigma-24 n=1 Tax=Chlorobium sp. TaxID=1095 RepID=UPI0025C735C7|nr:RNA polymerase subunit sigma-24 [Chlorobium sp.]MCF8382876.1 sigma-70 region 4 domain-containing protein [Chlorobium sp.]
MAAKKREPLDLLDEMYSLGYWMTGSLKKTNELVLGTYRQVDSDTPEIEVFKTFRDVYYERFGLDGATSQPETSRYPDENLLILLRQQETDRKLSVLLSEVCGLKHRTISIVLGKPLNTVRLWLSSGRKSMIDGLMVLLTCLEPALSC